MNLALYIQGIRKGREINRLERKAMEDPFLADALEGYNEIKGNHLEQITELQKQISQKTSTGNNPFRHWSIAASFLILIGLGAYFGLNRFHSPAGNQLAEQVEMSLPEEIKIIEKDSGEVPAATLIAQNRPAPEPTAQYKMMETVVADEGLADEVVVMELADQKSLVENVASITVDNMNLPVDTNQTQFVVSERNKDEQGEVAKIAPETPKKQSSATPKPVAGSKEYEQYLKNNLVVPADENGKAVKGKVVLTFQVDESGRPYGISVAKSLNPDADAEAIRLIKNGPEWTAGDKEVKLEVKF
ncbi:MAG: energy transducer TonB [Candidatus Symbiothrix sp.]|jgi:TonB family protein|nr:energy transducer TonB [Candidatus Symbiothrix sp.]